MGYVSDAQRKAVHASKADGGKGAPTKKTEKPKNKKHRDTIRINKPSKIYKPGDYVTEDDFEAQFKKIEGLLILIVSLDTFLFFGSGIFLFVL